jgi:hypothetical protein
MYERVHVVLSEPYTYKTKGSFSAASTPLARHSSRQRDWVDSPFEFYMQIESDCGPVLCERLI